MYEFFGMRTLGFEALVCVCESAVNSHWIEFIRMRFWAGLYPIFTKMKMKMEWEVFADAP